MDNEFCKQHAKTIRKLAGNADPFVKKRLLDLAERYDRLPSSPPPVTFVEGKKPGETMNAPEGQRRSVLRAGEEQ